MIEVSYLNEKERLRDLSKETPGTVHKILQILDTEYGADRDKYEDEGEMY